MIIRTSPYPQSKLIKGIRWLTEPIRHPGSCGVPNHARGWMTPGTPQKNDVPINIWEAEAPADGTIPHDH